MKTKYKKNITRHIIRVHSKKPEHRIDVKSKKISRKRKAEKTINFLDVDELEVAEKATKSEIHKCQHCPNSYAYRRGLLRHIKSCHKEEIEGSSDSEQEDASDSVEGEQKTVFRRYKCEHCPDRKYVHRRGLNVHMKSFKHDESAKLFSCYFCYF